MIRSAIAFGVRAVGCLYVSYWAIFFGSVAFLIITSYLREHGTIQLEKRPHMRPPLRPANSPKSENRTASRAGR
jgi:hypothetical protein